VIGLTQLSQLGEEDELKEALALFGDDDINQSDQDGMTPLMVATKSAHPNIVKLLMENGANPRLKNKEGARADDLTPRSPQGKECLEILKDKLERMKLHGDNGNLP